jgi:hypothetical protein
MSENQPSENTVKTAFFVVLAIGFATLYTAVALDPTPPRHCNAGTVEALFTACDQRASR